MGEEIVRIAARGDGITGSGKHVPGSAPGDRLDDEAGLIWGPHHAEPPCQHFDLCGGCSLQQLDDKSYGQFVYDRIAHSVEGQSIECDEIAAPVLSPPKSRRRASLRAIRMGRKLLIGFHTAGSHRVVDMQQCEIMRPELFEQVAPLRKLLDGWPGKSLTAVIEMTLVDQGVDVHIKNLKVEGLAQTEALLDFARTQKLARLTVDQGFGPETTWEPDPVTVSFGKLSVAFPVGAFLQPTMEGEKALMEAAAESMQGAKLIADLFCGVGTFAAYLSEGRKVYAAEASRDSIMSLKLAANARQMAIFTDHRDLFRKPLMPEELNRFEAILLDPPRAGAKEQIAQLAESNVAKICYISCNPVSWSRDAKRLTEGGYKLRKVWPVGQFRWSTHVELVSLFEKTA